MDSLSEEQRRLIEHNAANIERQMAGQPRPHILGGSEPPYGRQCREHKGAPCWPLVRHAYDVLMDRDRWPEELCAKMCHETIWIWTRDHLVSTMDCDQAAFYAAHLPVPIGRSSLIPTMMQHGKDLALVYVSQVSHMPLPGNEYAAIILSASIPPGNSFTVAQPTTKVTVFGLIDRVEERTGYRVGDIYFTTEGPYPEHRDVAQFKKAASTWWAQFRDRRIARINYGGRPSTRLSDPKVARTLYRKWRKELDANFEPLPHTVEGFAIYAGVSPDTVSRRIQDNTLPWHPPK